MFCAKRNGSCRSRSADYKSKVPYLPITVYALYCTVTSPGTPLACDRSISILAGTSATDSTETYGRVPTHNPWALIDGWECISGCCVLGVPYSVRDDELEGT